jgi:hypothetical protein
VKKVLFILKRKDNFNAVVDSHIGVSTGLYNSASFVNKMLQDLGVESNMEVAIDNNCIDRLVTKHRPSHVIIEALWVVPTKFTVLNPLHKNVTWIVRLHSEMPFLAGEGMAMDWLGEYANFSNILIGVNAPRMMRDVKFYLQHKYDWSDDEINRRVIYMPNYYPTEFKTKEYAVGNKDHIDIGCFGAIRPLKNHMLQAMASIRFAESLGKKLHFHINGGRIEMKGEPVMNNLRALFEHLNAKGHQLISHGWTPRDEFLELCATMDIGMQCSFSETFNIVGADFISQGVPILGSSEIPWSADEFCGDPTSSEDIFNKLTLIHNNSQRNVLQHQDILTRYVAETQGIWAEHFKNE